MLKDLFHSILCILLLAGSLRAQSEAAARLQAGRGPSSRPIDPAVREQFLGIERIARLPAERRSAEVPKLYAEVLPPLAEIVSRESMASSVFPPEKVLTPRDRTAPPRDGNYGEELETAVATMTPEQVADTIASYHGAVILRRVALKRLEFVLLQFRSDLDKLIQEDLDSPDLSTAKRGFSAIAEMRLKEFVEPVSSILITGPSPHDADARKALAWMQSKPEAAKPFLADLVRSPAEITRYRDLLRIMLFHEPPDPVLLKLMESSDAGIRRSAAIVLEETDQNSAIELVPSLTSDPDLEVRLAGLRLAFKMPIETFGLVRAAVVPSLNAPSLEEQVRAAAGLAGKHDPISAPVLLRCLKNPQLPAQLRGPVGTGTNILLNSFAILRLDMANWGPDSPQNAKVIERLEQWIASQPK
jgi:hypothetical protein